MMRAERNRIGVLVGLVVGLLFAQPARAQWPTVLMFHGGPLKEPVFVTAADSVAIAGAFRPVGMVPSSPSATAASMGDRPFISVACFWGPPSNPAMNGVQAVKDLRPEMASQHARLYPATRDQPVAIFSTSLITLKGRDISGTLNQLATGGIANVQTKTLQGRPAPADAAQYLSTGPVPASAIETMKKLGIPVGP